jgi:hypothetical protein
VGVLDNASCHNVQVIVTPTSYSKNVIQDWLQEINIPFSQNIYKVKLYELIKLKKADFILYKVGTQLTQYWTFHSVFLQAWAQVKIWVMSQKGWESNCPCTMTIVDMLCIMLWNFAYCIKEEFLEMEDGMDVHEDGAVEGFFTI